MSDSENFKKPKIAPIFVSKLNKKKSSGQWKIIEQNLYIFTTKNVEPRQKIAAFDLDGTLIRTKSGKVFPTDENDWILWHDSIINELKNLHFNQFFKICIFTNQKGLQLKHIDPKKFKQKIEKICFTLGVPIQVFISVGSLNYRKPCIGMWETLEKVENDNVPIDYVESFFVGDAAGRIRTKIRPKFDHSLADRLFAINIGIQFKTPEQFFLKKNVEEPYNLPRFNPSNTFNQTELFEPSDVTFPKKNVELLIMVGAPGSGKTTITKNLVKNYNYEVVTQDVLKTWQLCVKMTKQFLEDKKRVIIDNTNCTLETRKRYIDVAKSLNVLCRCLIMNVDEDHACHNNKFRQITNLDNTKYQLVNKIVIKTFFKNYQPVVEKEGFDEIIIVNFVPQFVNEKQKKIYLLYLLEEVPK